MSRNIGIWALVGFVVACCWVVIGIVIGPSYNLGHSALVLNHRSRLVPWSESPAHVLQVYSPQCLDVCCGWPRNRSPTMTTSLKDKHRQP